MWHKEWRTVVGRGHRDEHPAVRGGAPTSVQGQKSDSSTTNIQCQRMRGDMEGRNGGGRK